MRYYLKRGLLALLALAAVLLAVSALTARPLAPHPYFSDGGFLVIAHRGGKGLAPENTLAAFARSAALGADILEMDLRQSKDGVPVVIHDRRVDRTTDGQGLVRDLTLTQLQALDAGYRFSPDDATYPWRNKGITIPTLDEVFTAHPRMRFLIEIKDDSEDLARQFCQTIVRFGLQHQVAAASFRAGPLEAFGRACPDVALSAPAGAVLPYVLLHWLRLDAAYHPTYQAFQLPPRLGRVGLIDRRFIERAHAHNAQVHAWTVNDPTAMRELIDLGIDGLITDYPDRLLTIAQRPSEEERR